MATVGQVRERVIPFLEVEELTRQFGGLTAVNRVSFQVQQHEIFGLIGPNGAGKTTLFNLLTGLITPSSGQMRLQQQSLTHLRPDQIACQGMARTFQNIRLFGELSVLDNVRIARHSRTRTHLLSGIFGLPAATQAEQAMTQRATELLTLMGLEHRADEQAKNLAYGDQRRLEIARALALDPQILLLDEPAAGMNPGEKHQLSELIRELRQQFSLTILMIEHHVPLVMDLCDRIAVLDFGELIALGPPAQVRTDPAVIAAYLGSPV